LISVSLFLVTLTFKPYFYYSPFSTGLNFLSILQLATILGWILLIAVPPLVLASEYKWNLARYWTFLGSVSLWTLSTLVIKIYTLVSIGSINYQYLTAFPILIYLEWLVPALYVYIAVKYYKPVSNKKVKSLANRIRFDDEDSQEAESIRHARERFDD
jgi:hypothetical protein